MTTMEMPLVRAALSWRRIVAAARTALGVLREHRAADRALAARATAYRSLPTSERVPVRGVYSSHRAPKVRRQRAARAPRAARHTLGQGRRHVELPRDWRKRFEMSHRMAWARPTVAEILAGV